MMMNMKRPDSCGRIMEDGEQIPLIWRNHYLVAFRSYSHESNVVPFTITPVNILKPTLDTFYDPSNRTSVPPPLLSFKDNSRMSDDANWMPSR